MKTTSRILVTGASGMVGKSLVKRLRDDGYENLLLPGSRELDNRDQAGVRDYFRQNTPEFVFHLAGHIGGIKASITRPVEFMYENLVMAMNVIHAAHESEAVRLMYIGSSCIYPRNCPQPMKEEHMLTGELEPTNEGYAIAKISGIKLCEYLHQQHGRDFFSLLPCNLYGFHDHFEPEDSHVLSALIFKMHSAKVSGSPSVEIWGTGQSRREFLFADDFADAMVFFMNYEGSEFPRMMNIGSGEDHTIKEIANMVRDVVGYDGELTFNADKPDGMPKKLLDVARARDFGWQSKIALRDGLEKSYNWYLENEAVKA
ncbi:MAG: GDP-L-fucose synthase [Hyphomicrobiales bacterium]|nr:GDP-L-fucose synthase [Hyphomicrobiales bacterium]